MADRGTPHAPAPTVDRPAQLRNVVLVGASGAGKTTLVESLALTAGALTRAGSVPEGTTVSDYEEIEHQQQRSVQLSLVPVAWRDTKINLLDTPGYADFTGELRAGLRAAEAAVLVLSAAEPIGLTALSVWRECRAAGLPTAIALTHLNAAHIRLDETLAACQEAFGEEGHPDSVLPLHLPVLKDGHLYGSLELLTGRTYGDPGDLPDAEVARGRLVEAIAGEDDTLLERYVAGEDLDPASLTEALRREFLQGTLHPVLATAPPADPSEPPVGAAELLDLITEAFPTPAERQDELPPCDPDAPVIAQVVHTSEDPYVGRLSLVRVFSGTVRPDTTLHLARHPDERVTALTSPFGKQQRPVPHALSGDLVCLAKLSATRTGDTLASDEQVIEPWSLPEALLPTAVEAHSKADEDKLSQSLARLTAQDPALRVEQNPDTHQLVLWCTGEAHQAVVLDRLRTRYGVHVDTVPYKVALRETFGTAASGHGRHVKQSGGHGQFAICDLEVEPLPGGGFEFVDKVVGGAVPRNFIPSVEKGVRAQLAHGVLAGYPMVDVRVTLRDGKAHSVDSSDAAFQTAAALALREAASHGSVRLLEPVDEVQVLLPDEYQGAVLTDLSARRGHVLGTERGGPGLSLVRAEVPEIELTRYPVELRSLSHGTGQFSRTYVRHAPMPAALAAQYEHAS
ncbi:elongation factor G-like protein EF-G2 [Kitasatospora atroaurantiaca]|uniref:Translation elongation factor 2 (EF-2/EF-G) n=1 Tax=Kitasatospora atroaurantiaca TaxID=285545 RepID=A0A561EZC5_9ACTN|nr:elongation factor G-like protein EF-G2 [Kitasatospora atroaurantiaca]TWE20961.1 translation elongation factor 2 (EF-2/EF-G) [Kitasatospora atroaurantiaca]